MLKNKSLVMLLLIMMIVTITGTSRAADYSCKVSLLVNNNGEVKKGDSITILVKATNIQAGEGIASFNTILEYDSNVFECTVSGDDEGVWQRQGLVENSLSMTRSDLVANSSDQTIAKIVLKAKSDAPIGNQSFKLTKMEFSTGEETFSVADVSTTITIKDETTGGNNNQNTNTGGNNTNTNTPNGNGTSGSNNAGNGANGSTGGSNSSGNSGNSSANQKNTSTIANVSSSDSVIPKTGVTDVLIIGAIIGTIAAIIFYIKYKRAY